MEGNGSFSAAGGWMHLTLELSVKLSQFDLTVDVWTLVLPIGQIEDLQRVNNSDFCESTFRSQIQKQIRGGGV